MLRITALSAFLWFCVLQTPTQAQSRKDPLKLAEDEIIELHDTGKLYDRASFPKVRKALADAFVARNRALIDTAYGKDKVAIEEWFDKNPDIRDKFYTAINEKQDKVSGALELYRDIWLKFPDHRETHHELAIAVALVWDDPRVIYNYGQHQRRAKANMPAQGMMAALENFKYYAENDRVTEGRARLLPWEYLVFVVDHQTPEVERKWAYDYYVTHKTAKSWHQDVPYDHGMLAAEKQGASTLPKLNGQEYTLSNLKSQGGVCTHQSDFALRVAKSVGIPAVYCTGMSSYRGGHAWWMCATVTNVNPANQKITYSFLSDGRIQGFIKDAFYVGDVTDPHTGKRLNDHDLERQFYVAANDRLGKRMITALLQTIPMLTKRLNLKPDDKLAILDKCLKINPLVDDTWNELIRMSKNKELVNVDNTTIKAHLTLAMTHLKTSPDFLQQINLELLKLYPAEERLKLYLPVMAHFEKIGRPDLACDARLKVTDDYIEGEKWKLAIDGLFLSVNKFPTEGRFVPKMAKKIETIADKQKGSPERLVATYMDLIPKLNRYYGTETTITYQLVGQAVAYMDGIGKTKESQAMKAAFPNYKVR